MTHPGLRTHQRNVYHYFLKHGDGCRVPLHSWFGVRRVEHLNALHALEQKRLINLSRSSENYLTWTMRSPSRTTN